MPYLPWVMSKFLGLGFPLEPHELAS